MPSPARLPPGRTISSSSYKGVSDAKESDGVQRQSQCVDIETAERRVARPDLLCNLCHHVCGKHHRRAASAQGYALLFRADLGVGHAAVPAPHPAQGLRANAARAAGGRIICVGTTSLRTLESTTDENGIVHADSRETDIFIYPGYKFKAADCLITNFHLPESTLLMLVSALAGRDNILNAYKTAVNEKYRFFSFGDAMFIHD